MDFGNLYFTWGVIENNGLFHRMRIYGYLANAFLLCAETVTMEICLKPVE